MTVNYTNNKKFCTLAAGDTFIHNGFLYIKLSDTKTTAFQLNDNSLAEFDYSQVVQVVRCQIDIL